MLTEKENETLTRVGPGTPMGTLMRRYWHPVAARSEMDTSSELGAGSWTKRVRLLGEDLVLYKDRSGAFGLIGEFCPHRRASLAYGIPTDDGIRCPYHGWKFDGTGACLEQPNEPEGSNFKDKIKTAGYPIEELGGLLWAYLGPLPAPLIPRLDGLVVEGAIRSLGQSVVPCNWLQQMENSVDPCHTEWLHGNFAEFVIGTGEKVPASRHTVKIGFDEFEWGIVKRRLLVGQTEDCDDWAIGHPLVFPNMLAIGSHDVNWTMYAFQIRVPMDDTHTMHYWYNAFVPPPHKKAPQKLLESFPVFNVPYADEQGEYLLRMTHAQDIMCWVTQGAIANRTLESLGSTDRGITLYRKMLFREIDRVAAGQDPICVIRDPKKNELIELPLEKQLNARTNGFERSMRRHNVRFSPQLSDLIALFGDESPSPAGVH
jgi:5,5'-dehydrodivanillate O-demethylase oxygenase subunit